MSVGSGDTDVLGDDVDGLVTELEALRIAIEETSRGRPVPASRRIAGTGHRREPARRAAAS